MCNPIVYLYYCYCICIKLCGISIILCMYFHMTHVTSGSFFPHISCQKRVFRRYIYIFENVRNYVKCAFKFMHLIWSVWISVYIILHLMPVILFVVVTEGYFVIHLLLWRKKYIQDILSLWVCHFHPWAFQTFLSFISANFFKNKTAYDQVWVILQILCNRNSMFYV